MIPNEIYINEYLENGGSVLGALWRDIDDQVYRERDRNYLRTLKFVRTFEEQKIPGPCMTSSDKEEIEDRSEILLEASQMLQTISSSGYCEAYELGWNEAVKHNRLVLKCAAGDTKACAQIGQIKIPAHVSTDRDLPGA